MLLSVPIPTGRVRLIIQHDMGVDRQDINIRSSPDILPNHHQDGVELMKGAENGTARKCCANAALWIFPIEALAVSYTGLTENGMVNDE
jgi:hypothetical protein